MTTFTPAQVLRNQHIAKVKAEIARLTDAVTAVEQYTANIQDWAWVGDWAALAQDVIDATDKAEAMARTTEYMNQARRLVGTDGQR